MRTGNSKRKLPCLTTGQGLAVRCPPTSKTLNLTMIKNLYAKTKLFQCISKSKNASGLRVQM